MLGSPIAHSKSPQLHLAAYRALGLHDWTYDRIECSAEQLPGVVGGFGPEWVGVSVTMPGKFAALRFADEHTTRAEQVGSANTLVRTPRVARRQHRHRRCCGCARGGIGAGVGGRVGRHRAGGRRGVGELGVTGITVVARNPDKAARLVELGTRVGVSTRYCGLDDGRLADEVSAAQVLVSTLPADVAARYADTFAAIPVLLDAIYNPWPTPLAAAVQRAGGRVVSGLQMLLHQAFAQVEQFTGMPAPREAMTCALAALD